MKTRLLDLSYGTHGPHRHCFDDLGSFPSCGRSRGASLLPTRLLSELDVMGFKMEDRFRVL